MTPIPFVDQFDALHEAAARLAGHDDFGDRDYEAGMRVLLAAMDEDMALNDATRIYGQNLVIGALAARLHTQAGWNAFPEVRGRRIDRPVIIIGKPRTGTTALHRLLALDPQFQGVERWLLPAPMPRPPRETWDADPRYQRAVQGVAAFKKNAPNMAAAHCVEAWDTDECIWITAQTFCSNWFGETLDVPAYNAWFYGQDESPVFRRHADVLNLVGKDDPRRWLLKNPSHLMGVQALLNVYPDACVIWTHRHPGESIPSMVSLIGGLREFRSGVPIDRDALRRREIAFWSEATRRGMAAQDRHPDRIIDVRQEGIRADPMGVVARIYDHFGLELSAEAELAMLDFARANPPDAGASHAYAPLGDDTAVRKAFADYIDRYELDRPLPAVR